METNVDQQPADVHQATNSMLINFVSSACIVITLILFVVPYKAIKVVIENQSVGQLAGIQFISSLLNCFNWLFYSILVSNLTIFVVNGSGAITAAYFIHIFSKYLSPSSAVKDYKNKLIYAGLIYAITVVITLLGQTDDDRRNRLGTIASTISVLNYAAPLEKIKSVLEKRNSEGMVKEIAFISLLCSISWSSLGLMLDDVYVYLPNMIATVLSLIQCSLVIIYPSSNSNSINQIKQHNFP